MLYGSFHQYNDLPTAWLVAANDVIIASANERGMCVLFTSPSDGKRWYNEGEAWNPRRLSRNEMRTMYLPAMLTTEAAAKWRSLANGSGKHRPRTHAVDQTQAQPAQA